MGGQNVTGGKQNKYLRGHYTSPLTATGASLVTVVATESKQVVGDKIKVIKQPRCRIY